jgi:hypothetical protein
MISEAAIYTENSSGPFFSGVIGGRTGDRFHVQTHSTSIRARKASSCLLVPAIGDQVLVFSDQSGQGEYFILSVLSRSADHCHENELLFDGPTRIRVNQGDLKLQSEGEIQVAAAKRIDLTSNEIHAHACKADVKIDQCSFFGRVLNVQAEMIKSAARTIDYIVTRWTLRADNSARYVRKHDEVQAESARYLTEKTLTMHSKNAVHTGEELVSINGGQINLS